MIIKRIINIGLKGREIFQIEIHKKNNKLFFQLWLDYNYSA